MGMGRREGGQSVLLGVLALVTEAVERKLRILIDWLSKNESW